MLRLLVPFVALLLVVAVTLLTDKGQAPADFTFINRGDVATLDLQRMSWMQDLRVARMVSEGLVKADVFTWDYRIIPGVAERWEISPDGLVYTFHLRGNAKWDNGEPVRAGDFVYAWRRGLLPDIACDYAAQFQLIKGGAEFYAWRQAALGAFKPGDDATALWERTAARFDELVGVRAADDRTLRVELARPAPYFLDLCGFAVFYPVYPPLVEQYERPDPATGRLNVQSGWTKPPYLVSNGPFRLTAWRFKRDMRFAKSPTYWDRASINIDTVAVPSVEDPNAAVLAFRSGAVDWVSDVTPTYRGDMLAQKEEFYREHRAEVDRMRTLGWDPVAIDRALPPDPRKNISAFPAFGTYFYNFNCEAKLQDGRDNPFADPRVRRALSMAVDKRRVAEQARRIGERPARTLVPPGSLAGYHSPAGLPCASDGPEAVEQARRLLAQAGYPGGRGFITVEILFNKDGGHDLIAEVVAKDWQENLGIQVSLVTKEIKVFRNDLKKHNFMVSRAGWYGDYGDPLTFLDINKTGDGNNDRNFSNPAYDALLERAASEVDAPRRLRILEQAEAMIVDDQLPVIPLFHYSQVYLFNPDRISGISSHPRQEENMYQIDVLGDGKGADKPLALPARPPGDEAALGGIGAAR